MSSSVKRKATDEVPTRRQDGHRGQAGLGGWWVSLQEAQERSVGNEKWWLSIGKDDKAIDPASAPLFKNASPTSSKPVWMYENGDMYLGDWEETTAGDSDEEYLMEQGYGITYNNYPAKLQGYVYIGEWQHGAAHGEGVSFWLPSSHTWKKNHFGPSPIQKDANIPRARSSGIPFRYEGTYQNGAKQDEAAVVTLKDGTTRIGHWTNGNPVGNWHTHTLRAVNTADESSDSEGKSAASPPHEIAAHRASQSDIKEEPTNTPTEMDDASDPARNPPQGRSNEAVSDRSENERHNTDDSASVVEKPQTDEQRRMGQIQQFIADDVIGNDPSPVTMERYASRLYEEGFESIQMIKHYLRDRHVQSYDWMSELHKEIFLERLQAGW